MPQKVTKQTDFIERKLGKLPMNLKIMGVFLFIAGIITLKESYYALSLSLLGVILFSFSWGITIDFTNQTIKKYWNIGGIKFGKWNYLPTTKHISVLKFQTTQTISSRGTSSNYKGTKYKIILETQENKKILISIGDKNQILSDAKYIQEKLKTQVVNNRKNTIFL